MEDSAPIYKKEAWLALLNSGICTLLQPLNSPDLNPIEKVWRQMKQKINKLPFVIIKVNTMKEELQKIQDRMDPKDFRVYTKRLTCRMEEVIKRKGFSTGH